MRSGRDRRSYISKPVSVPVEPCIPVGEDIIAVIYNSVAEVFGGLKPMLKGHPSAEYGCVVDIGACGEREAVLAGVC